MTVFLIPNLLEFWFHRFSLVFALIPLCERRLRFDTEFEIKEERVREEDECVTLIYSVISSLSSKTRT